MSLLLEHIEANIDSIISDENQIFYPTVHGVEEGEVGSKVGAAAGAITGTIAGAASGSIKGRLEARKIPQFVAYKRADLKAKDFVLKYKNKDKPVNYTKQLQSLEDQAAKLKFVWKQVRNKLIDRVRRSSESSQKISKIRFI